ncbi:MAG: bile acid:sodium symporter [Candidatus Pacebacteria bacterium]|nr:bile acid:sodium symporter [Candidatus Paceibacterota bacterium]
MKIFNLIKNITESHYIVIGLAFFVGIFYSQNVLWASSYTTSILAGIFFLSALKIDLKKVLRQLEDKWALFIITFFILLILPVVVYYIANLFFPSFAVAFLLLSAMPAGMVTPLLTEISGGRQSLALVLAVITSLLAPLTVPFIVEFLVGTSVKVDVFGMFKLLAIVIYIPFFVAQFFKRFWQRTIDKVSPIFKSFSTILLGILIMIIVAKQSNILIENFNLFVVVTLFVFFFFLHIIGYFLTPWRDRRDRITISVCVTYMNFTLAIELANKFFSDPNIILPIVLSIIPWSFMFIPFKTFVKKI